MDLAQRLARLEARDEIRELTARYCHAVVDGDGAAVAALFCSDGWFETNGTRTTGHAALEAFYTSSVGNRTHKPFIQNHVIEFVDDDRATGRCSVEIRIFQKGRAVTAAGHYFDDYRRENGRWRFAGRRFHAYHFAPWTEGWTS